LSVTNDTQLVIEVKNMFDLSFFPTLKDQNQLVAYSPKQVKDNGVYTIVDQSEDDNSKKRKNTSSESGSARYEKKQRTPTRKSTTPNTSQDYVMGDASPYSPHQHSPYRPKSSPMSEYQPSPRRDDYYKHRPSRSPRTRNSPTRNSYNRSPRRDYYDTDRPSPRRTYNRQDRRYKDQYHSRRRNYNGGYDRYSQRDRQYDRDSSRRHAYAQRYHRRDDVKRRQRNEKDDRNDKVRKRSNDQKKSPVSPQ